MGDRLGILGAVGHLFSFQFLYVQLKKTNQKIAPGEARTHGLQIMRLTRCLLRYRGYMTRNLLLLLSARFSCERNQKRDCVGRESNPGQLLGRQLCSPLYHQRLLNQNKGLRVYIYMEDANSKYKNLLKWQIKHVFLFHCNIA